MTVEFKLRKSLLYSAIVAGLGLGGMMAAPVWAQDDNDNDADEVEELADLERILVTGSRIERVGIDTFYPAISVDSQLLEDGAFTNVADALNQIPSFGPGLTPAGPQGGFTTGQNFVNFLGLGTQRTLTLVNGRRFVSSNQPILFGTSGGLQVDFNVIPVALVDRIETIGVGGAPIYGSDAIAGTINVITRDNYEGFETVYRFGMTEESDNKFHNALMVAGTNFADMRGNVYFSAEYDWQDPLEGTARPNVIDNSGFLTDSDGVLRIYRDRRINLFATGGLVSNPATGFGDLVDPAGALGAGPLGIFPDGNFYMFDPNSNLVQFTPGEARPGSPFFATGGDGPTFFDEVEQINTDLDRGVFTSGVTYELDYGIRFSSDFLYATSNATELVNQGGFQTWAFGGPGDESGPIGFSADNPFLPQQARDVLAANDIDFFYLHRFNNDIIDSSVNLKQNLWRVTAGLDGEFFAADRRFNWDLHFIYGNADLQSRREGIINERFFNAVEVRRLTEEDMEQVSEIDLLQFSGTSSAGAGDIICESVFQAALAGGLSAERAPFVNGCVPLNLFGEGARSDLARDWVTGNLINQSDITQSVGNFSFGGDLFELPGGAFSFAAGYERRTEKGFFTPDAASEIGLSRSAPFPPTGGEYTTDEFFGEFSAPLVSPDMDIPFAHLIELNGAYRSIDNSLAGSDDIWTLGGRWAPMRGLTFRGNYTEAVRAPSIVELFTPQTAVFSFANDPCDARFVDAGPSPDTRRSNCEADPNIPVAPDDFTSNVVNATASGRSGGNPNLGNEQAESWALGFSYEPEFIDNFLLTVDWLDVTLDDAIVSLGLTSLMVACYDSENFPNVDACDSFTRDENGQIVDFLTGQTNAQTLKTSRMEIGANYRFTWDNVGDFTLRSQISYANSRKISVTGETASETIGGFTFPKWAGTQDIIFARDRHRLFWRVLWQDQAKLSISGDFEYERDDGGRVTRTRFRHLHNMSYSYALPQFTNWAPEETLLQFNIDNVFDRQPDTVERAAFHYGFSELLGRRYTVSLRARF
jgi:iron complex outermembrane recepter protein